MLAEVALRPSAERVPLIAFRNTRSPAVPENVNLPFWPGVDNVTPTDVPPAVIDPVTSAGTLYNVTVTVPVVGEYGSSLIVYVPDEESVVVLIRPLEFEKNITEPNVVEL